MTLQNPFEVILDKIDKLQSTVNDYALANQKAEKTPRNQENGFLTLPEIAIILKKPLGTVRGYVHSKGLPAKKMGKGYLINKLEFNKWLARWQAENPQDEIIPSAGYTQMLDHRRKYGRS
ncbi:MAG: hypothetical protein BGN92_02805 [Sphingobacteriales bacterium 41-5]|nr:MAG: hypothetical protein BGN92_02805 [Sphingobacteriales bacterium 41-5]